MDYPKCNLHTHTAFCDGKQTPEELVLAALAANMNILGFSGHSYTAHDTAWCMSREGTAEYRREIARLQEKYRDRIRLLCGIEQDLYAADEAKDYDYVIGSVHYLRQDGIYMPVDESRERLLQDVDTHFCGNIYRYLAAYYEQVAQLKKQTGCDIIGHFDLVEKFNEGECLFSPSDYRYRRAAVDALDAILEQDVILEINTGAMARGYRSLPYPSAYLLRRIAEKRGRVMLNSDAHTVGQLLYGFSDAVRMAASCGIGGLVVPGKYTWELRSISSFTAKKQ